MFCPRSALEQSPMQTLRNSPLSVSDSEFDTTSPYSNKYPPCKLNFPLMDAGHTIADISLNPAMPYHTPFSEDKHESKAPKHNRGNDSSPHKCRWNVLNILYFYPSPSP